MVWLHFYIVLFPFELCNSILNIFSYPFSLYDTIFENLPQAIVGIAFCFASLEHARVKVWLGDTFANLFGVTSWTFVVTVIGTITIFGLITSVVSSRYSEN